jgi:hypothetical protein
MRNARAIDDKRQRLRRFRTRQGATIFRDSRACVASAPNSSGRSIGAIIAPKPPLDLPVIARVDDARQVDLVVPVGRCAPVDLTLWSALWVQHQ